MVARPKPSPRLKPSPAAKAPASKKRRQVRFVLRYLAAQTVPAAQLDHVRALKGLVIDAEHSNMLLVHGPRNVSDFEAILTQLPGWAVTQERFYAMADA